MKEERFNFSNDELNRYIVQARQLRSEEIARLWTQLFRLPVRLAHRLDRSPQTVAGSAAIAGAEQAKLPV